MNFFSFTTLRHFRFSVSAFYFIQGLVFSSWASRIPDIKDTLHLNDAEFGSVLFALPIGQFATMAVSGYLVSRFGSKRILSFAAVLYPMALIGLGAAATVWQLTLGLVFFGITSNMCNIAVNTQGVGVERIYRQSIMASFHGLWSLAGVVGGVISTWMVARHIIPLYHFCIIAVIDLIILFSVRNSMLPRDNAPQRVASETQPKQRFFSRPDRYIVVLGLIAFCSMICEGTMFDWSSVYFEQIVQPGKDLIRVGYIAFMSAMTCGRFTADRLITRSGAVSVMQVSGILIASGLAIAVAFPYFIPSTIGFLLVGFGTSSIVPLCYSMAGKSKTMFPGIALATVSTIGFFGFLFGPPLIGYISHAFNLRWSFAFVAIIGLGTTLVASLLRKH